MAFDRLRPSLLNVGQPHLQPHGVWLGGCKAVRCQECAVGREDKLSDSGKRQQEHHVLHTRFYEERKECRLVFSYKLIKKSPEKIFK